MIDVSAPKRLDYERTWMVHGLYPRAKRKVSASSPSDQASTRSAEMTAVFNRASALNVAPRTGHLRGSVARVLVSWRPSTRMRHARNTDATCAITGRAASPGTGPDAGALSGAGGVSASSESSRRPGRRRPGPGSLGSRSRSDQIRRRKEKGSAGGLPPAFDPAIYHDLNTVERGHARLKQ